MCETIRAHIVVNNILHQTPQLSNMKLSIILALAATALAGETINNEHLKTEVVTAVDCKRPTVAGDKIHVHCTSSQSYPRIPVPLLASPAPMATSRSLDKHTLISLDRGTLESDGSEFDASYNRGQPLSFKVGSGQVIKGWDQGLLDMCPGEKRKLTIQPDWAYGSRGAGPIPANSVLIFETELVSIDGVSKDEL
ncbi:uncharacterized protein M421DRAFT_88276 [Didymella exigua CBS 183.55]|uniref:peptidylprolyl isomerase n=1 Tax=Didymella exigua CBS 183.55 TaxID=1150837 RepID=A0A6A5S2Y6_9PLEO|nr:uncharacterized protein M421DRAFT_88276 [Didymella exigua CBS 183.55]KAF1934283.1 hypothetical protein M421DRAFT_88276 [Didymella exigua CBS 183.55]